MTRSIFDPAGGQTERSGSTFGGPAADNNSRMPPDLTDGKVSPEEAEDLEELAQAADPAAAAADPDTTPPAAQAPATGSPPTALDDLHRAADDLNRERADRP